MKRQVDVRIISLILRYTFPDSKVQGSNIGLTRVLSAPVGPHVCPLNLAIRVAFFKTRTPKVRNVPRVLPIFRNILLTWSMITKACTEYRNCPSNLKKVVKLLHHLQQLVVKVIGIMQGLSHYWLETLHRIVSAIVNLDDHWTSEHEALSKKKFTKRD